MRNFSSLTSSTDIIQIYPTAFPLLSLKDDNVMVHSPIDPSLAIPIILQPNVNRRDIVLGAIFKGENGLFSEYLSTKPFSDSTQSYCQSQTQSPSSSYRNMNDCVNVDFLLAKMELCVFSLNPIILTTNNALPVRSIFPKTSSSKKLVAVPPFLDASTRSILLAGRPFISDSDLIRQFVEKVLTTDFTNESSTLDLHRWCFPDRMDSEQISHLNRYDDLRQHLTKK